MTAVEEFIRQVAGTLQLRWYAFAFLLVFLIHAHHYFSWRRAAIYTVFAYVLAWACEYGSITRGFPFGVYQYIETTKDREIWVKGVPFFDSLSFVFLGYFSHLAGRFWLPSRAWLPMRVLMGGFLMMLLDIIIDPLTLQGEKWFLGRIYTYPTPGPYFGVTLENFWGWFGLGCALGLLCHMIFGSKFDERKKLFRFTTLGVYFGIAIFNLALTFYIDDHRLGWVGVFIMAPVALHFLTRPKERSLSF